jgi:hypothetical protein
MLRIQYFNAITTIGPWQYWLKGLQQTLYVGPSRLLEIHWNTATVTKLQTFGSTGKSTHGLLGLQDKIEALWHTWSRISGDSSVCTTIDLQKPFRHSTRIWLGDGINSRLWKFQQLTHNRGIPAYSTMVVINTVQLSLWSSHGYTSW